jgi:hypothetical protein
MSGFYSGTDPAAGTASSYADKVFYGFRLVHATGQLLIEVVKDGSLVALPDPHIINVDDYANWVWSSDALSFTFTPRGHLQVQFL